MYQRFVAFLQLWFLVCTHMATAGIVFGAAFCVLVIMISASYTVIGFRELIQLLFVGTLTGVIVGSVLGGASGAAAGFFGGAIVGLITALFFYPPRKSLYFPLIVHVANLIPTISIINSSVKMIIEIAGSNYDPIFDIAPAAFASLGSYIVIRRMIRWYNANYSATPSPQV